VADHFIRKGAQAMVTTEKDSVNLPEGADDLIRGVPLYWLKVGMRIEGESDLLEYLLNLIEKRS